MCVCGSCTVDRCRKGKTAVTCRAEQHDGEHGDGGEEQRRRSVQSDSERTTRWTGQLLEPGWEQRRQCEREHTAAAQQPEPRDDAREQLDAARMLSGTSQRTFRVCERVHPATADTRPGTGGQTGEAVSVQRTACKTHQMPLSMRTCETANASLSPSLTRNFMMMLVCGSVVSVC